MKKLLLLFSILIIILVGAWLILGSNKSKAPTSSSKPKPSLSKPKSVIEALNRSDEGEGGVTIDVTYATDKYFEAEGKPEEKEKYELDKNLVFIISLNTHTVDLAAYSLDKLTFLQDDQGNSYSPSTSWESLSESSHHRSGILKFSKASSQGNLVISEKTKFFEIVIKDIAGAKTRVFRWDLPIKYP